MKTHSSVSSFDKTLSNRSSSVKAFDPVAVIECRCLFSLLTSLHAACTQGKLTTPASASQQNQPELASESSASSSCPIGFLRSAARVDSGLKRCLLVATQGDIPASEVKYVIRRFLLKPTSIMLQGTTTCF